MAGRASAFAVLGLAPGADAEAVERAYKRLIKQHHPDRAGGDSGRAADINRAYRELRRSVAPADPVEFNDVFDRTRRRPRWPLAVLVGGAAIGGLVFVMGPSVPNSGSFWPGKAPLPIAAGKTVQRPASDSITADLHERAIDAAVVQAVRLYRTRDEMALARVSRDCHRRLRDEPGTELLDRCAAFDDAVVGLQDRDPLRDAGPFAPLAVTGRQWSAASALSDDSLAIDGRLDQIRLEVELALAPEVPPVAPAAKDSLGD